MWDLLLFVLSFPFYIFRQLLGQQALVLYMLLPLCMTSCVAHNDVYNGGGLLHFTSYTTLTIAFGFLPIDILLGATFFI